MSLIGPATAPAEGRAGYFTETRASVRNGNGLRLTETKSFSAFGQSQNGFQADQDRIKAAVLAFDFNTMPWNGASTLFWQSGVIGQGPTIISPGGQVNGQSELGAQGNKLFHTRGNDGNSYFSIVRLQIRTVDATWIGSKFFDGINIQPLKDHNHFAFISWFPGSFPQPYEPSMPDNVTGDNQIRYIGVSPYLTPADFERQYRSFGYIVANAP